MPTPESPPGTERTSLTEAERAAALGDRLREAGIDVRVTVVGGAAVLGPVDPDGTTDWRGARARIVALARQTGFSRVALEIDAASEWSSARARRDDRPGSTGAG